MKSDFRQKHFQFVWKYFQVFFKHESQATHDKGVCVFLCGTHRLLGSRHGLRSEGLRHRPPDGRQQGRLEPRRLGAAAGPRLLLLLDARHQGLPALMQEAFARLVLQEGRREGAAGGGRGRARRQRRVRRGRRARRHGARRPRRRHANRARTPRAGKRRLKQFPRHFFQFNLRSFALTFLLASIGWKTVFFGFVVFWLGLYIVEVLR